MQHNKRGYFSAISGCTEVSCLDQLDAILLLARHQPYLSRASNSESRFSADQIVLPVIPTPVQYSLIRLLKQITICCVVRG
jgi:hypothetical protein